MKRAEFKSLIDLNDYFRNEEKCIQYFIKKRWNGHITCPHKHCQKYMLDNNKIYILKSKHDFKCACCGRIFSYKTGTIFENSKVPMKKWFMAIYLQSAHKKGISSVQLAKDISITQKSAWFMLQRIREVMKNDNNDKFTGTTEIDEAYLGGSETNRHADKKNKTEKTCIIGLVNRDTKQVRAYKVSSNEKDNLLPKVYLNCKDKSNIFTDSYNGYDDLKKHHNHEFVKHCVGEYNGDKKDNQGRTAYKINTNSIEGFWSQLKRGIYGVYHWASNKHIQRYVNEFAFRYNTKNKEIYSEITRFNCVLQNALNKRLKYSWLIG